MSEGATREQAAHNIANAIAAWIDEARVLKRPIPKPRRHLVLPG
jgi:predicted RNase H-like HicB family nuclease